jgi:hypothetical protein
MHIRITKEPSRGGKDGAGEIYYLREVPHVPGRTIQATALSIEGARWMASRWEGVTQLDVPAEK